MTYTPTDTANINAVTGTVSLTTNKASLTITASNRSKTYGTAVTFAGTEFTASALVSPDTVTSMTLNSSGAAATATVAGSPYAIVPSAAVGTGLGNYTITYVNGVLTINPKTLTVTATGIDKVYDGTTTATVTLTDNRLPGDNITDSYTTASFENAAIGIGKTVYVSGISISGVDAGNYILGNTTATTTANIFAYVTTTVITNAVALGTNTVVGQSYPVTFSVTASTSGTPTGNVTVSDGTDTCSGTVASGSCLLTSTSVGTKALTATYAGDGNYGPSVSSEVLHSVVYRIYLPLVVR
jgi:hypothetical protein